MMIVVVTVLLVRLRLWLRWYGEGGGWIDGEGGGWIDVGAVHFDIYGGDLEFGGDYFSGSNGD